MNIFIACSKHFYHRIPPIKECLEKAGHIVMLPNSYDEPFKEEDMKKRSPWEHSQWKREMMRREEANISSNDGILVLNYTKNGQPNYIGGATFMEIVKAWELEKQIYILNKIPKNIFEDELRGINPLELNGNLETLIPHGN